MKLKDLDFNRVDGFDLYVYEMSEECLYGSYFLTDIEIKPINGNDEVFLCIGDLLISMETSISFDGSKITFVSDDDHWSIEFFKKQNVNFK
jgi:hypothetical protein